MWFVVSGLPVASKLSSYYLGYLGGEGGVSEGVALFAGGSTARHPPSELGLEGLSMCDALSHPDSRGPFISRPGWCSCGVVLFRS